MEYIMYERTQNNSITDVFRDHALIERVRERRERKKREKREREERERRE